MYRPVVPAQPHAAREREKAHTRRPHLGTQREGLVGIMGREDDAVAALGSDMRDLGQHARLACGRVVHDEEGCVLCHVPSTRATKMSWRCPPEKIVGVPSSAIQAREHDLLGWIREGGDWAGGT